MTGLPTVLGWYVHEWLWRNNLEEENQRKEEVQTIYTSSNVEQIKSLIEKYKISYYSSAVVKLKSMERSIANY